MKTIVTHLRPHLDDICAAWLLKRFLPDYADAGLEFVSTSVRESGDGDLDRTYVGVGRGRFDEHKGDAGECATTLVFAHVRESAELDDLTRRALERIVGWVLLEDTGRLMTVEQRDFTLPVALRGEYDRTGGDSASAAELGFGMLDALLVSHRDLASLEEDWEGRIEFQSRFGPAVAIRTDSQYLDSYVYGRGFALYVQESPDGRYRTVRAAASTPADLAPVCDRLREMEPKADWYCHHSGQMLINGGPLAPEDTPSKLSLEEIIELLK